MKKYYFLLLLFFITQSVIIVAQTPKQMPRNIREHLSLWHLGRIDSTYLQNIHSNGFEWTIIGKNDASRNPPTGIITSYHLSLFQFEKTAWLVEISSQYQHNGKRLSLTYFDGEKYNELEVPYQKLKTIAQKNIIDFAKNKDIKDGSDFGYLHFKVNTKEQKKRKEIICYLSYNWDFSFGENNKNMPKVAIIEFSEKKNEIKIN